ncbi:MAG: 3-dehydroquinate synthase, partial [Gammaproteobacteria bacterium]
MKKIMVHLNERSYPIYIGIGLLAEQTLLRQHIAGQQVLIVSNPTVAPYYLKKVRSAYKTLQCDDILLPDGEQYKTLAVLNNI